MHNYDSTLTVFFKKVYYDKSLSLLLSCERPSAFEKGDDLTTTSSIDLTGKLILVKCQVTVTLQEVCLVRMCQLTME